MRSQLLARKIAVKGALVLRNLDRQQLGQRRMRVAALGEREPPAQKQNAAAAAVGEFADQVLLRLREVVGLHAPDDQPVEGEQLFGLGREPFRQLMLIGKTLPVYPVLRGAQHGGKLQTAVVFRGPADEFEFPARLAFDIKDARLARLHVDQPPQRVVVAVLFARQRIDGNLQSLRPGQARVEQERLALRRTVRFQLHFARCDRLPRIAHRNQRLLARITILAERHQRAQTRIGQRVGGQRGVGDFDILLGLLAAEPDGVYRNAPLPDLRNRVQIDAAGIIRAIRQQHHGAQRQRGRFREHLLQAVAQARSRLRHGELAGFLDALGFLAEAIEAHLKLLPQRGQQLPVEHGGSLRTARLRPLLDGHAARIVDQHGHYVLLRPQCRNRNGRVP